jgi:hypothetical protein
MSRKSLAPIAAVLFSTLACAAPLANAQSTQLAQVKPIDHRCSDTMEQRRAREAAKKGPQELRRFIWRTRMIYALDIHDFGGER